VHLTPLSERACRITDAQDDRILIEYRDGDETVALEREKFEGLYERIQDTHDGFEFGRLPPNAEPYATVLSLHSQIEVDNQEKVLRQSDSTGPSSLIDVDTNGSETSSQSHNEAVSLKEMLNNMSDPENRITCPISGCQYSHRSAASVASHVSGSSTDKHIWANTDYAGWRDFVRKHD
jgi:hypothetical protein